MNILSQTTGSREGLAFSAQWKIKLLSDIVCRYLNRPTATSTDSLIFPRPSPTTSLEVRRTEARGPYRFRRPAGNRVRSARKNRGGHRGRIFATCSCGGGGGAEFSITPSVVDPYHSGAYSTDSGAGGPPPFAK